MYMMCCPSTLKCFYLFYYIKDNADDEGWYEGIVTKVNRNRNGEILSYNVKYSDKDLEKNKDVADILPFNSMLGKYWFAVDEHRNDFKLNKNLLVSTAFDAITLKKYVCQTMGCAVICTSQCLRCGNKAFCNQHSLHGVHKEMKTTSTTKIYNGAQRRLVPDEASKMVNAVEHQDTETAGFISLVNCSGKITIGNVNADSSTRIANSGNKRKHQSEAEVVDIRDSECW